MLSSLVQIGLVALLEHVEAFVASLRACAALQADWVDRLHCLKRLLVPLCSLCVPPCVELYSRCSVDCRIAGQVVCSHYVVLRTARAVFKQPAREFGVGSGLRAVECLRLLGRGLGKGLSGESWRKFGLELVRAEAALPLFVSRDCTWVWQCLLLLDWLRACLETAKGSELLFALDVDLEACLLVIAEAWVCR